MRAAAVAVVASLFLSACAESPAGPGGADCEVARPDFGVASEAERALFAYDADAPLNLETTVEDTIGAIEVAAITFDSPGGGSATGLLFDPVGRPSPRPGIVLMHGMPGSARDIASQARVLASHGAVVIAIDAPFARRAGAPVGFTAQDRDEQIQLIKDLQRAVDVLLAHPGVDDERIAYHGTDYGAGIGALFVGIEERIETAVLVAGDGGLVTHFTGPGDSDLGALSCAAREAWLESMTPIEPIRFIAHAAPMPLLLQNGRSDNLVPEADAEALHAAAPASSTSLWYEAGHALNQQAFLDRVDWLHEHIGLDTAPPIVVDSCALARPDFGVAIPAERELFAYDVNAPLNLEQTVQDTVNGVEVRAVSYDSPDGGRVTGLLFDPITRSGLRPGVVLMHDFPGSASIMTGTAELLTARGAVVIAIDAPFARRGGPGGPTLQFTTQDRDEQIQLIKDLQRAVDVLLAHPGVDGERIAYQGAGYGGSMGALFVAIERRIQGAALVTADGGMVSKQTGPGDVTLALMPCAARVAWLRAMTPIEPIRFVAHATPTPVLLQNGLQDNEVPTADADALHAAAPEPKTIRWYAAGHNLGPQAFLERVGWLHERIGLDVDAPAGDPCAIVRPQFDVATAAERSLFAYDIAAPLNLEKTVQSTVNGVETSAISYDSPGGGRVTGFMFDPVARLAPRPGIVLMHGMPSNAASMSGYANLLATYGAVVIAIDAPFARRSGPSLMLTAQDRDEQIQLMKDLQRAVDILRADPRVDDDRIAYVGFSFGGGMGALFAGIEERIETAVLVVADAGLVTHSTGPEDFDFMTLLGCERRTEWLDAMVPIEPIRFIAHAWPTPLLLQNGELDNLVPPADAITLHNAAPASATILWYNAGHGLNLQAAWDRHDWLTAHIGLDHR